MIIILKQKYPLSSPPDKIDQLQLSMVLDKEYYGAALSDLNQSSLDLSVLVQNRTIPFFRSLEKIKNSSRTRWFYI